MAITKAKGIDFNGNEDEYARRYIDFLLPFMKESGGFTIPDAIRESDLPDEDKNKANALYYNIRTMITTQLAYAQDHPELESDLLLTQKGIKERKVHLQIKNLDKTLDFFYEKNNEIIPFNIVAEFGLNEKDVYSSVLQIHHDGYLDKISVGNLARPEDNIYIINFKGKLFKLDGGYKSESERIKGRTENQLNLAKVNMEKQEDEEKIRKLTIDNLEYEKENRTLREYANAKDNDLKDLQIKELKRKRIWAFFGAIGGAALTYGIDNYKVILRWLQLNS